MFGFEDPNIILGQEMYNFYNIVKEIGVLLWYNVGHVSFKVTCDELSYLQAIEPLFPC